MSHARSYLDRCFRNKQGSLVIGQRPNLPQLIGLPALVLSWPLSATAGHIAAIIALIAWLVWAMLEIVSGVNYFRRALGVLVLLVCMISVIR